VRSFLAEGDGMAAAFDRPAGGELPLAIRIAVDEADERGLRPVQIGVLVEPGVAAPNAAEWSESAGVAIAVGEAAGLRAAAVTADAIDLLQGEFAPRAQGLTLSRVPRLAVGLAIAILVLQLGLTVLDWGRLARESSALEAEREAIFRATFPEAKTIVDPVLQMQRNLADLQRSRGMAAGNDFLALATAAARSDASPARRLTYANGRLEVDRGAAR
jgi:general secretion pathway protein L